ncbi:MAG: aldehyde ferredoxin oxidoreductase family protein [Sedimentibacter saalensis]|jgi:aldehyde:ferredoxin oxidoreductase|uniref:aldehyde ferredoxin oxidoreductase family protein n=1 Tax=Sedimentibacter saalensis TaxID=130788 RepID=UPI002B1E9C09|nr:aldehyde ferredoxin oxidoreductase family protein [Sedimentibacter saalensis]MEA5095541.1 aldehyde ferredoxin oxidoreductase family protein [Sedimentibacter saalensis]
MYGYWKTILRINLTDHTYSTETLDEKYLKLLLGGAALGAKILLDEVKPKIDPLSPENKIIFSLGFMQSVNFPGNAKWTVVTKGPLTGSFLDSAGTGAWAPQLKKAGYDVLVVEGKSENPVYIFINDDKVEFRDASSIWGKDTIETSKIIKEELGDKRINAINIGPSGENLNPIACISCDGHSFAGRGGAGAIMGSKNLKAIAVWGTKQVPVADLEGSQVLAKELFIRLHETAKGGGGTPDVMVPLEELGDVPIKYWRGDVWHHGAKMIGTPRYTELLNVKPLPCQNCPVGCHRHINLKLKDGSILDGNGPEYETLGMLGASLLLDDLEAIAVANDRANRSGIDTVSLGSYIGFVIECYEAGFLSAEEIGMVPRWNDEETLLYLEDKISRLEGVGSLFRKGIRGAVEIIGQESAGIAVEVKNLDLPAHDPRAVYGLAVNYATSPRGACHERGNPQASALGLFYPDCDMDSPPERFDEDSAGYCAYVYQNTSMLFNNLTMCKFMVNNGGLTVTEIGKELKVSTGLDYTNRDLLKTSERGIALQRLINVRDGMSRKDDTLPPKMLQAAVIGGRAGKSPAAFEKMLDDYYKLRGWDENGIPTAKTLEELGLEDYIPMLP